jgi:hypothetical protein
MMIKFVNLALFTITAFPTVMINNFYYKTSDAAAITA